MGEILYNGKKYKGNNINVLNNKIYIDGLLVDEINKPSRTLAERLIEWINPIKVSKIEISGEVKIDAKDSYIEIKGDLSMCNESNLRNCDIRCNNFTSTADLECVDFNADDVTAKSITCVDFNARKVVSTHITVSGDINCDNVESENITVTGDMSCDNIKGNVTVTGDLNADDIIGKVIANEINADSVKIQND